MVAFKADEIVVLLGAGASVDAGIPHSAAMIQKVECNLDGTWAEFKSLYHYLKSAIFYGDGVNGKFGSEVNFNIERLVNTLDEIAKQTEHPLYPFVGSWNSKLLELGGANYEIIARFRRQIVEELKRRWLAPLYRDKSAYYRKLVDFIRGGGETRGYNFPLRVFSLNYDLAVENNCNADLTVERGFDQNRAWDWRLFDVSAGDTKDIYLYKLHGSIDWRIDAGRISCVDEHSSLSPDETAIIFGTTYKLQYVDPFLFFAYELRRWTLEARLIVAIGYGFGDEHINGILAQALKSKVAGQDRKLLVVAPCVDDGTRRVSLMHTLEIEDSTAIEIWNMSAKEFFDGRCSVEDLGRVFPAEEELFSESTV